MRQGAQGGEAEGGPVGAWRRKGLSKGEEEGGEKRGWGGEGAGGGEEEGMKWGAEWSMSELLGGKRDEHEVPITFVLVKVRQSDAG